MFETKEMDHAQSDHNKTIWISLVEIFPPFGFLGDQT